MDNSEMPPMSEPVNIIVSASEPVKRDDSELPLVLEPIASASEPVKSIVSAAEPSIVSAAKPVQNIVLVGRSGNGKSATGNSIIGKKVFISGSQATGVTMTCETYKTETPDGLVINVIDTPGLSDLSESAEYMSKEIIKLAAGGIHVVVLVISLRTRITQEEENTLSTLQSLFGIEIMKYLIVLFTGGDELEANNSTLDTYLSQGCPEFLKTVLRLCDGRRVMINNKTTEEGKKVEQVKQFLDLVTMIGARNGGKPYTDDMYHKIKEESERFIEQQKEIEAKNLAEEELAKMKLQLQMSYDIQMRLMSETLEDKLRDASTKHERMMFGLQKGVQMSQRETNYLCGEKDKPRRRFCNIL